jgi:hypothetical protein
MPAYPIILNARWLCATVFVASAVTAGAQAQREFVQTPTDRFASAEKRSIVEGLAEPLDELQITDLNGRDIAAQVQPRTENSRLTLNLAQPTAVVLKPKTVKILKAPTTGRIVLPGGAVVPRIGTAGEANDKAMWFRITLAASPMPAAWDSIQNSYTTVLTFGLKAPDGAPPTLRLEQPVIVKLAYDGLLAPETPIISLDAPGIENEKTVALHFKPSSKNPTVLVRSTLSDTNIELTALPRLILSPDRNRVLGFGLETVTVSISSATPEGRNNPVQQETPVVVSVQGAARMEAPPKPFALGTATTSVSVRTAGLGDIVIRADADGVAGSAVVQQTFPLGPLIAALIGGALGGFSRRFVKGARRSANGRRILEGTVVSMIVFVAGVLGVGYISLPAAIVATEAGAFLTGALGGFIGVSVLEAAAKRARTGSDPA